MRLSGCSGSSGTGPYCSRAWGYPLSLWPGAACRILAGWVPAADRARLSLSAVQAPPVNGSTFEYTLWPYGEQLHGSYGMARAHLVLLARCAA